MAKERIGMDRETKTALVSDFDGTISDDDFFNYVSQQYLGEQALTPWREYMAGEKTHFEALREIFASLRIDSTVFDDFICSIKIDRSFFVVADFCRQNKMPVYICSAGCDYYIERLIGQEMKEYGIRLVANHGVYNPEQGLLMMSPPEESPFWDPNTGVSKAAVVRYLQQEGYRVVYCGDGMPDVAAASIADDVFARKMLFLQCRQLGIVARELEDFNQVCRFLKGEKE